MSANSAVKRSARHCDRLERAGLITRRLDPGDRRSFLVTLSEDGMAAVDAAMSDHAANVAALLVGPAGG